MNRKDLYQSMNQIDDDILERSEVRKKKTTSVWLKWGAMVACLCLIFTGSLLYYSLKPVDFNSMINKGSFDTTMTMTTIPVDEQIACYQQIDISGKKLEEFVGAEYLKTGSIVWYIPEGTDNLKYLIRKEADNTLTLWMFTSFEPGEGGTYTYGDVLAIIYGVDSADDIVSITTTPSKGNNTSYGMEIQKKIGTQTYSDSDDILSFYDIVKDVICYGVSEDNPADNTRFTYSFSTDGSDKLATGESTYGTRCISIEFADGTILDSWKYSALSGSFFEHGGIFTEPLADSDVSVLNNIFGIK